MQKLDRADGMRHQQQLGARFPRPTWCVSHQFVGRDEGLLMERGREDDEQHGSQLLQELAIWKQHEVPLSRLHNGDGKPLEEIR